MEREIAGEEEDLTGSETLGPRKRASGGSGRDHLSQVLLKSRQVRVLTNGGHCCLQELSMAVEFPSYGAG